MSRRTLVQPRWLDCLLWNWAIRSLKVESGSIGYYTINPMLKEGIPTQATSYEPTGFNADDFEATTKAIDALPDNFRLVILRAYKPWAARAMEAELDVYGVSERTWQRWTHEAAVILERALMRKPADPAFAAWVKEEA